jgi:WD40 repeat protein
VAYAADGTLASGGADSTVRLWDVERREVRATLEGHKHWVCALAFHPNSRTLASASHDRMVRLWDVTPGKEETRGICTGHTAAVSAVAFTPDGRTLTSAGHDGIVGVWDAARREPQTSSFKGHRGAVEAVAYARNGRTLASGSLDQIARLWDLATATERRAFDSGANCWYVAFSADGQQLALPQGGARVMLRDVDTGAPRATLTGHKAMIMAVAFGPADGHTLVTASDDHTSKTWDLRTQQLRATVKDHSARVWSVACSPVGTLAASGSEGAILLWDTAADAKSVALPGAKGTIYTLMFAPDGKTLFAGSSDKTVRCWEVPSGKLLTTFTEHKGPVRCVVFSPSGRLLAEAGDSGQIILRDRETAAIVWQRQLPGPVHGIAFSPDGQRLATANANGTIYILRLP